jgi:hypothetical protein
LPDGFGGFVGSLGAFEHGPRAGIALKYVALAN